MSALLSREQAAALRAVEKQATPAPWAFSGHEEEGHEHIVGPDGAPIAVVELGEEIGDILDADPRLIRDARNLLPQLLSVADYALTLAAAAQAVVDAAKGSIALFDPHSGPALAALEAVLHAQAELRADEVGRGKKGT